MTPDKTLPLNDVLAEMEFDATSDSSKLDTLNSQNLRSMAEVAREIRDKEAEIDDLEKTLKARKEDLRKQSDEELPSMMAEIGVNEWKPGTNFPWTYSVHTSASGPSSKGADNHGKNTSEEKRQRHRRCRA